MPLSSLSSRAVPGDAPIQRVAVLEGTGTRRHRGAIGCRSELPATDSSMNRIDPVLIRGNDDGDASVRNLIVESWKLEALINR